MIRSGMTLHWTLVTSLLAMATITSISFVNISWAESTDMKGQMSMSNDQNMSGMTTNEMGIDTKNAEISKVITRDYGSDGVLSLVFVKYAGVMHANHIAIFQINQDVKILKSSTSSKWIPEITGNSIGFHSDISYVSSGKSIVIKVITNTKPSFKLNLVASH